MKRLLMTTLGVILLAGLLLQSGHAEAGEKNYGYMDMKTNRTYVPIRYLKEQLKVDVNWNPETKGIVLGKGDNKLSLTVGHRQAKVNDIVKQLEAAPFREGGATYVPLRIVTETMNLHSKWDKSGTALVFQNGTDASKLPMISLDRKVSVGSPIKQKKQSFQVSSKRLSANILEIDLLHPDIQLGIGIANGQVGSVANLKQIATSNGAIAAMNGTFFNAYTKSSWKAPYGYIVRNGKMIYEAPGEKRTVLIFSKDNHVEMISGAEIEERFETGNVHGALQAGPRLLTNGKITVDPKTEGFRDPKILTSGGARSAVGITKDHKLILLTTSGATIPQLANVMKQAGAYQAMNLDGGASSGLFYNGKYVTTPGRDISNALLIYKQK